MSIPTNEDRADRAREILRDYCRKVYQLEDGEESASVIGDILADLRHLCAEEGIDFEAPLLMSEVHFNEENDEENDHDED